MESNRQYQHHNYMLQLNKDCTNIKMSLNNVDILHYIYVIFILYMDGFKVFNFRLRLKGVG
jgi:hypothetical protein